MKKENPSISSLNHLLAAYTVTSQNARFCHWNVIGPMFEDNHEFFGDLYSELADQVDIFAEQVRILGEYPMSKLVDYLNETTLVEYSLPMSAVEMQKSICDDLAHISSEMIVFIDATDADPTTQDFIISAKQAIDKRIWMLRAMLGKK